jgi:predicted alpha/beta-hydrolase family hydrolase
MAEEFRVDINEFQSVTAIPIPRARVAPDNTISARRGRQPVEPFHGELSAELASRGIDTVTFNFFYSEQRRGGPDQNDKLEACYRAVIEAVRKHKKLARNRLAIGGKSMGGRIASQVGAAGAGDLAGLVFLGYPLHPPGNPEKLRSKHLPLIKSPMLFIQGSRDNFGTAEELRPIIKKLLRATLHVIESGDHSLKVPKSAGPQETVYASIQDEIARWLKSL